LCIAGLVKSDVKLHRYSVSRAGFVRFVACHQFSTRATTHEPSGHCTQYSPGFSAGVVGGVDAQQGRGGRLRMRGFHGVAPSLPGAVSAAPGVGGGQLLALALLLHFLHRYHLAFGPEWMG
jgi:hypothetical protein